MKRAMTILLCVVLLLSAVPMASAADDNYGISVLAATNDEGGITATVVLDNYSNLKSLGFYLSFDSEKLEYKAHNVSGFLSKAMGVVPNVTHGSFNIASLGMNAYSGSNETILTVEFGIKEGVTGACEFNLSNFNFATTTGDIKTASGTHTAGLYLGNTIVLDTSSVEPVKYKSPAGAVTGDGVSVVSAEWKPHVSYPGTFEAGTTYELILKLTAKEGYSFNADTKVSVNKGTIKENSTTYDAEEKVLTTIVQFTTAAQTITKVDVTGDTNITIPDLKTGSKTTGNFALTLKDGETTVENYKAVVWDVSFSEAAVKGTHYNVSYDETTGIPTVTVLTKMAELVAPGGTVTMTVTAKASESVKDSVELTLTRAASDATSLEITGDDSIVIPAAEGSEDATASYSAIVLDQYGKEMTSVSATLSSGSSLFSDGKITVPYGTTPCTVTLTAGYTGLENVTKVVSIVALKAEWPEITTNPGIYGYENQELVNLPKSTELPYTLGTGTGKLIGEYTVLNPETKQDAGKKIVTVQFKASDSDANGNYKELALTKDITVTIDKKDIKDVEGISLSEKREYNGEEHKPEPTVTVAGLTYDLEYSNNINAGTEAIVKVTAKTDCTNYKGEKVLTFTIVPKTVEVKSVSGIDKTYDGTAAINKSEVSVTVDGFVSGEEATVTVDSASYDSTYDVGVQPATVKVSLTGENAGNYCFEDGTKYCEYKTTGNIIKADAPEVAAYAVDVYYDDVAEKSIVATNIKAEDENWKEVSISEISDVVDTLDIKPNADNGVVKYQLPDSLEKEDAGKSTTFNVKLSSKNYNDVTVSVTVKAVDIQITWPEVSIKSDATYGDTYGDIVTITGTGSAMTTVPIYGTFAVKGKDVVPGVDVTEAYLVFTPDEGQEVTSPIDSSAYTIAVSQKNLADVVEIAIDAGPYPYTGVAIEADYELILNDKYHALGITYDVAWENNINKTEKAELILTGTGNYTGTVSATFEISGKIIEVTPDSGQFKIYGEDDPVLTYTYLGGENGEIPAFGGALSRVEGENVGEYEILQGSLKLVDGEGFEADNYSIKFVNNVVFTIEKKSVDISWDEIPGDGYEYNGKPQGPKPYFNNVDGDKQYVDVERPHEAGENHQAKAVMNDRNYTIGAGEYSDSYTINPLKIKVEELKEDLKPQYVKVEKDEEGNPTGEESSVSDKATVGDTIKGKVYFNGVDVTDQFQIKWYYTNNDGEAVEITDAATGDSNEKLVLTEDLENVDIYYVPVLKENNSFAPTDESGNEVSDVTNVDLGSAETIEVKPEFSFDFDSDYIKNRHNKEEEIVVRVEDLNAAQRENFTNLLFTYGPYADIKLGFSDVAASAWYYDYVTDMANAGVINGYPDGTFRPEGDVTWGETLKLVMKAVGYPDIPAVDSHWASGYMATAIADLLISGEVDLDAAITREDVANLTAQALKLAPAGIEYPFEDNAPEAAVALYAAGIITGSLDNGQLLFRAESTITRAEMAAIIYRVYNAK